MEPTSPNRVEPEDGRLSDKPVEDLTRAKVVAPSSPPANARGAGSRSASPSGGSPTKAPPRPAEPESSKQAEQQHEHRAPRPPSPPPPDRPSTAEGPSTPKPTKAEPSSPTGAIDDSVSPEEDPDEEPSILPFVYLPASKVYLSMPWQCFAFVWLFLFTMFLLCMVLTATTWRYPDPDTQLQLPDIALDTLPRMPELEHVTDLLLAVLELMCFTTVGLLYLVKTGRLKPVDVTRLRKFAPYDGLHMVPWIRFFVCFTAITFLRIIVVGATVLPSTNNHCKERPDTGNFWWNSLIGVLSFGGSNVHCGDLLFSGHTAVITLSVCAVWDYGPIVHRWFRPVSGFLMVCTWFTILLSRSHYTDDIVVAFYFAVTLWILTPHDPHHGAPALWQLLIQNPYHVYRKIQEATAERDARRAARQARGADAV